MKYLLFDLFVALSVAAILCAACRVFGSLSDDIREANGNCANPLEDPQASVAPKVNETFNVGEIVEVYEPSIHPSYAFFAKVAQVSPDCDDSKGIQYDVQVGFAGAADHATYQDIPASAIKPMEPFEANAKAMCDEGRALNSKLIPCTVDFPMANSKNMLGPQQRGLPSLYSVSFQKDGEWRKKMMPVSRIRRIVHQDTSMSRGEDHWLKTPTMKPVVPGEEEGGGDSNTFFTVGSVIEIYSPEAMHAFPATVTGLNSDAPTTKYHLTHGITHASLKNVDSQFLRPYQVYEEGAEANCNVGKLRKIYMVPCTVMSHTILGEGKGGDIIYQVSAKMEGEATPEDDERILFLPRLRVQRFFRDNLLEGHR